MCSIGCSNAVNWAVLRGELCGRREVGKTEKGMEWKRFIVPIGGGNREAMGVWEIIAAGWVKQIGTRLYLSRVLIDPPTLAEGFLPCEGTALARPASRRSIALLPRKYRLSPASTGANRETDSIGLTDSSNVTANWSRKWR